MSLRGAPRLSRALIERPRLTARFEVDDPLVVAYAPAGMGKTVAMAQWANDTQRRGVWMRVGDGTRGSHALIGQVALVLSDAGLLDEGNPLAMASDALRFAEDPWSIAARGLRRVGELTVALDETDRLDDETINGLVQLLADLPCLHLRATTRRRDRFSESSTLLAVDTHRITQADLILTRREAAEILGRPFESEVVTDVLTAGGGAPALARMIALSRPKDSAHPVAGTISALQQTTDTAPTVVEIVDSLLRARAARWPDGFTEFIEVAALADGIRPALAAELTGRDDAMELLDFAEAEGLGYWHTDPGSERARFGFSPFIRTSLEAAARRRLPAAHLRRLALAVARADLADGRAFAALRGAVQQADWQLASDVMRRHWNGLFDHARQVRELFAPVPLMTLRNHPLLTVFLAIIFNARGSNRLRALEYFALAAYGSRLRRPGSSASERALLSTIETASSRLIGRARAAERSARDGYAALLSLTPDGHDELGVNEPTAFNQIGTTLFYAGDTATAIDCFRRSTAVGDSRGLLSGLQGLALAAGAHAVSGDMVDAQRVAAEAAARTWPDGWRDGYAGSFLVLAEAMLAIEHGDADAADAAIRTLDPHRATIEHWALLLHADVLILLLRGEAARAVDLIEETVARQRARHAISPLVHERLRHTRALALLARGDIGSAESVLRRGDDVRTAVSRARVAIAGVDPDRALRLLSSVPSDEGSSRSRAENLALTAAAVAMTDDSGEHCAAAVARMALHLSRTQQRAALAFVPAVGLDALLAATSGVDDAVAEWIADARRLAVIASERPRPRLTGRELVIAEELSRGATVSAIADRLSVSPNTVKSQMRSLYRKLEVGTRSGALRALAGWGFIDGGARDRVAQKREQHERSH